MVPASGRLTQAPNGMVLYERASAALAAAVSVDEAKDIRDKAIAMQVYAKQAKDRTLIENATELRMRAERRAGELLREMKERGERHKGEGHPQNLPNARRSRAATVDAPLPKLSDLGVTKTHSSRWQRLASMETAAFESRLARAKRKAMNALDGASKRTRQEMRAEDEARVARLRPLLDTSFLTLVIDFPWRSDWLSEAVMATPYATMTEEELFALPVAQWAAEQCHLYFWTPSNFMPVACRAVAHFGFQHRNIITWKKPKWGNGFYFRNITEHVIFATRGDLHTRSDSIPNWFEAPLGEHSEKPERFYEIVRAASYPPYGEAFQRKARPDFVNLYQPIDGAPLPKLACGGAP